MILSSNKEKSIAVANQLVEYAEGQLDLSIPNNKYMMLAHDPVPFLGYIHSEHGYRILQRNERRYVKKLKRMTAQGKSLSQKAMVWNSPRILDSFLRRFDNLIYTQRDSYNQVLSVFFSYYTIFQYIQKQSALTPSLSCRNFCRATLS